MNRLMLLGFPDEDHSEANGRFNEIYACRPTAGVVASAYWTGTRYWVKFRAASDELPPMEVVKRNVGTTISKHECDGLVHVLAHIYNFIATHPLKAEEKQRG